MKLRAVIFDFDEVIVRSYYENTMAYMEVSKLKGLGLKRTQLIARYGRPAAEIIKEISPSVTDSQIREYVKLKNRILRERLDKRGLKLIKGVKSVLTFLKRKGIKIAIVTSSGRSTLDFCMRKAKLSGVFDITISSDDVRNAKPHPEPMLKAARALGVKPSGCVCIGDSVNEMIAAKSAGMLGIGITTGFASKKQLKGKGAWKIVKTHAELLKILKSF